MQQRTKPDFNQVYYDRHTIVWGRGNNAVGLQELARFQIGEPTKSEDKAERKDYEKAKFIYDKYINKGQRFKPAGKMASRNMTARITFINPEKQTVSWKQDNFTAQQEVAGLKPASGKFSINSMINLFKAKEIEFLEEQTHTI